MALTACCFIMTTCYERRRHIDCPIAAKLHYIGENILCANDGYDDDKGNPRWSGSAVAAARAKVDFSGRSVKISALASVGWYLRLLRREHYIITSTKTMCPENNT